MRAGRMNRRTFLRGLGGVAIALPTLEIMLDNHGVALADGTPLKKRFGVVYCGASLGGNADPTFATFADGSVEHKPLLDAGVLPEIGIVNGLHIPVAERNASFHIDAMPVMATGIRGNGGRPATPTADQIAADHLGAGTLLRILHTQTQAAWYLNDGSSPSGRDAISYFRDAGGNMKAAANTISPKATFQLLFQNFVPPDPADRAKLEAELKKRKSILDVVRKSYERTSQRVGNADKIRIDEHLARIRDLEVRLGSLVTPNGPTCKQLPNPGEDPPLGTARGVDDAIVSAEAYSNEDLRAQLHMDMIAMALTCNLTNVFAHVMTMSQSHMNMKPLIGIALDMHECGHSAKTPAVQQVLGWHMKHFARLVKTLRDTPEGTGRLIDNCAIVFKTEGGSGFDPEGNRDNNPHSTQNISMLVAGKVGGLKTGGRVVAGTGESDTDSRPVHVLNTLLKCIGLPDDRAFVSDQKKGFVAGLLG
jgi:hypothetical protein